MDPKWKERLRRTAVPLLQVAAIVLIGLVYFLGIRSERTGFVRDVIDPGFRRLSDPVLNAFRGRPPTVALIKLELDTIAWDSLRSQNATALRRGRVPRGAAGLVAGRIELDGVVLPVVVGLREGVALPGGSKFWPLHVRSLPGDSVLGMQTFDIVPVVDEAPIWSLVLNATLGDQGISTLPSAIAEVRLNGKDMGLCMLQGRPDDRTLTNWSRGKGPVLRFDDAMLLDSRAAMIMRSFQSRPPVQGEWLSAPLLLQAAEGSYASKRAQKAIRAMDAFRSGTIPASQVFDGPQVAKLLALCDVLGTQQAVDWWDLRFLVDSASEKLAPIVLHFAERSPIASILAVETSRSGETAPGRELVSRFLADSLVLGDYLAYLDTFTTAGWVEAGLQRTSAIWEPALGVISAEFPRIVFDRMVIDHDRIVIRQTLEPTDLLLAYMRDAQDPTDGVALANVHSLPVEVFGIVMASGDTVLFDHRVKLAPRRSDRPLAYTMLPLAMLAGKGAPSQILVRIAAPLRPRGVKIRSWSSFGSN